MRAASRTASPQARAAQRRIAFSDDGQRLAAAMTGSLEDGRSQVVRVHDVRPPREEEQALCGEGYNPREWIIGT